MIRPGPTHLVIAKKLLRYLKARKNITLRWCAQDCTGPHKPGTIMAMQMHPLPIQFLIDTHQSDMSSCSTELLFLGAPVELLSSFSMLQKLSYTVYLVPLKKPSIYAKCVSNLDFFKPTRRSCTRIAKQLSPCQRKTDSEIAANTSPFAGALLLKDKVSPLTT